LDIERNRANFMHHIVSYCLKPDISNLISLPV